ncbi:MAG: hypothetical protein AAGF12_16525 [Myxococcota bacterium]
MSYLSNLIARATGETSAPVLSPSPGRAPSDGIDPFETAPAGEFAAVHSPAPSTSQDPTPLSPTSLEGPVRTREVVTAVPSEPLSVDSSHTVERTLHTVERAVEPPPPSFAPPETSPPPEPSGVETAPSPDVAPPTLRSPLEFPPLRPVPESRSDAPAEPKIEPTTRDNPPALAAPPPAPPPAASPLPAPPPAPVLRAPKPPVIPLPKVPEAPRLMIGNLRIEVVEPAPPPPSPRPSPRTPVAPSRPAPIGRRRRPFGLGQV